MVVGAAYVVVGAAAYVVVVGATYVVVGAAAYVVLGDDMYVAGAAPELRAAFTAPMLSWRTPLKEASKAPQESPPPSSYPRVWTASASPALGIMLSYGSPSFMGSSSGTSRLACLGLRPRHRMHFILQQGRRRNGDGVARCTLEPEN